MNNLTRQQVEALRDAIHERLGWMIRVRERMEKVGFLPSDRLFRLANDAENAMRDLCMALHYTSCEGGVGKTPDQSP